jgi:uncharacterized membrane protein
MSLLLEYTGAANPSAAAPSDASAGTEPAVTVARPRLDSIDLLRGLVMVVMALDHVRDFFGSGGLNPRDVAEPALFATRWVTHFCAPIFIFLAGISAWLYGSRGRSAGEISRFLLTRGLWLILIEFTLVRLGWSFSFMSDRFVMQVIFAIGASMLVLAALVHLPRWAIATVALALIGGHNLLDGIRATDFGAAGWIWNVLHQPALLKVTPSTEVGVLYPLVPWIGVMAAGYALGPVFRLERAQRLRWLVGLGAVITGGFVLLRVTNLYGDPAPWIAHDGALATIFSFINCEKYPPSLLYLMMTLGPGLVLLAAFENGRGRLADWITTYGRVPFFYYVAHLYVIHSLAVAMAWWRFGDATFLFGGLPSGKPAGYGLALPGLYAIWLLVVVALYPLCCWFAALKQRRREWWWSYL